MPGSDEEQSSGAEEFDLDGDDDGGDESDQVEGDDLIRDPNLRRLLQVPKLPSSKAGIDVLREAYSSLQLQYSELSAASRAMALEIIAFKAASKRQRNRYGGKPPVELAAFADRIYRAGKQSVLLFEVWTAEDAFDAKTRPKIDLFSPTRFVNPHNMQRARQAEVFDAIGGLDLPQNSALAAAMGSVVWIKNAYLAAAQQQRSHVVDTAKKCVYQCFPKTLAHLPFDDPAELAGDDEAALLRGGVDNLMPPFVFPLDRNGDVQYMMRSPILVRLFIACLLGKSALTKRRNWVAHGAGRSKKPRGGTASTAKKGGNKNKAELWGVIGVIRPEFMAFIFIICRFLLSGDETFAPIGSYNYNDDFEAWKRIAITDWNTSAMKETRLWWEACVWKGHDPDVLDLDTTHSTEELTPAQRRTEALLAQLRNPSQDPAAASSPSPSSASLLSPPTSSSARAGAGAAPSSRTSTDAGAAPSSRTPTSAAPSSSRISTGAAPSSSRTSAGGASARSRTATQAAPKPDSDSMSEVEDADLDAIEGAVAAMAVDDEELAAVPEPAPAPPNPAPRRRGANSKPAADIVEAAPRKNTRPSSSRKAVAAAPEDSNDEPVAAAKPGGRPKRNTAPRSRS
ncbi:hypothetical protein PsYK624_034300 [Phanerochaete sordida]|uniref:Uncharacterized protein n=1 Tax=Phanerochaete sordida TaxID=48140 RepID=A0A9P3G3C7_9APHY|nr:hypothetical protein PsYK624_034300 [Phanerochaete sordida]